MAGFLSRPFGMVVTAVVLAASARVASAQELEPRAYSASPLGTNFFAAAVGYMDGEVLFDPTVPITDAHASIDTLTLGYGRTFGLGGKLGLVTVVVPAAVVHAEGLVGEASRSVRRRGFADLRVKTSINLLGVPAVTPAEFAKSPQKTTLGVSLTVQAPNGQYDGTLLVNLGTNRWAFKPELGVSIPVQRWSFDVYAGAWFFTDNDAFYPGASTKRQDPLTSLQTHVSYTFKNRAWLAFDATWYGGGETTVDANPPSQRYSNTRVGGTFSVPIAPRQSIKFAASRGASARTGSNFDSYVIGWQLVWFDRPKK
jgi:hypothetical protein